MIDIGRFYCTILSANNMVCWNRLIRMPVVY